MHALYIRTVTDINVVEYWYDPEDWQFALAAETMKELGESSLNFAVKLIGDSFTPSEYKKLLYETLYFGFVDTDYSDHLYAFYSFKAFLSLFDRRDLISYFEPNDSITILT